MIYIVVLSYGLICYLIGEFFGRAKHIGRWWTMFLFWSAPIPLIGLLALIFSPSAKKTQTSKYNSIWLGLGVLFLLLSLIPLINIFSTYSILRHFGYVYFTALAVHGIYFILLGTNKIINSNPKYYFKDMNFNLPQINVEEKTEGDTTILKEDFKTDFNESSIQPSEINENDELIQLQKLFDLGVVNLEEFNAKKTLIEEKRITEDILKQKKIEFVIAEENFKKKAEENKLALKSLKSLWNNGILTTEEYNSKVAIINEIVNSDKKVLDKFKVEGEVDWKFILFIIIFIIVAVIVNTW